MIFLVGLHRFSSSRCCIPVRGTHKQAHSSMHAFVNSCPIVTCVTKSSFPIIFIVTVDYHRCHYIDLLTRAIFRSYLLPCWILYSFHLQFLVSDIHLLKKIKFHFEIKHWLRKKKGLKLDVVFNKHMCDTFKTSFCITAWILVAFRNGISMFYIVNTFYNEQCVMAQLHLLPVSALNFIILF